ncbi:GNAT family N-acetyltransferase [Microbacterium betulae]|uniref:GNAT family N-acetyltransferase n=1 Tax=Microbacterium betulae TaxID=2981139 RepID=A0AA97FFL1_9MICO|nr:GNAT family N-acetyltransferase [Microbacterium sp. AB]WOF21484.1 GNAT family N-acetyltransferase [Microbacterium sp. AB]
MAIPISYDVRGTATDEEIEALHAVAFAHVPEDTPWNERLLARSLTWVTARRDGELIGFVHVAGDGGRHAFLLDTCVHPAAQGRGVGRRLVAEAVAEATLQGAEWMHVDYEPQLARFYEDACGMRSTSAALLRLRRF